MSVIRESSNFTISNSVLNNIQGNATIIRFGDGTLTKSEVEDFLRGVTALPDVSNKTVKHILIQSITNLPRAKVAYNDYQSQKKNGLCLKGTRETLLGELGNWLVDPTTKSQIYVLSGLAGIGKSTIAYTFASRADQLGILGASFFFSRDESNSKTAEKLFTTIAFQLCVHDKAFAQAIGDALLGERGSAAITKDLNEQLEALILEPLRDVVESRLQPTVIVIDALDECDDRDAPTVLASLERLVHKFPCFKVLLTTRPQPHLDHRLGSHGVFHLQNIEDKVINNDIRLYLKSSLSRENIAIHLPGLISKWSVTDDEIEYLVRAAGKLFIIASTSVRMILDTTARNPASQMQLLIAGGQIRFNDLESFYAIVLRRALPEKCSSKITERFKTVIGAILFVQEPLPVTALQDFTLPYTLDDIDAILKNLESVITIEHEAPRIFHKSFSDFLIQMCHGVDVGIVSEDQHRRLAACCLRILNKQLKRNILGLTSPACFVGNTVAPDPQGISDDQLREQISLELNYACRYWAIHLEGANIANFDVSHEELVQELSIFANEHLPHWIEVMGWIHKLDLASRALRIVHKFLHPSLTELRELFSDALRFISKFHPVIQQSALHTYHSALSFTPTETMLYKRYNKEMIGNICQVQGGPEKWDHFVTRQDHGEEVERVVFSQDSSIFASLGDRYAKFWDTITGAPIGTILDKVSAIADDFSTAAAYNDSTITLYSVNSCTSLATTNMAPASVVKLAISPDGCRLAVGLSDGTVCLWNWRSVDLVALDQFVWDKTRGQCCLAFNSSGDRLAFGTNGGMVLRNGISGELIAEMKHGGFHWCPSCVAFSRNGSRLAYRDECQLSLWDGKNGTLIEVTELKEPGHLIAISDDGALIAVNQDERALFLWSPDSGNCLEVSINSNLWNYDDYQILSMAFHHDGLLAIDILGSFSDMSGYFYSAALYDIKDHSFIPMEGCMTISPDNTRTVKKDSGSILQLMNLEKASLRSIKGREGRNSVKNIAKLVASWPRMRYKEIFSPPKAPVRLDFSPDCLRLASCYNDGTIDLWDTSSTRQLIATLKSPKTQHRFICVFNADGSHLASGSEGFIKLWDGRNGAHIGNIKTKYPNVTSIVFLRGILAARSQVSRDPSSESDITLWDVKTLRRIVTVTTDSSRLLEHFHHDTMLIYHKERRLSEDRDVTVWDTEKRAPYATIPIASLPDSIEEMVMSPDRSKLVIQFDDGNLKSFDLINGCEQVMASSRREDLDWDWLPPLRTWHGIPVWLHCTENDSYCVSGRSSHDGVSMPLLWIDDPVNSYVQCVARGSSMFALVYRSEQGSEHCHNIVILRSSPAGSFN